MERFGPRCKGMGDPHGDLGVDDAFSAHLRRPLTGKSARWKLQSLL
jgi:hypothetical protein